MTTQAITRVKEDYGSELFIVDVWALHQSSPVTAPADNEGTSDFDTPPESHHT